MSSIIKDIKGLIAFDLTTSIKIDKNTTDKISEILNKDFQFNTDQNGHLLIQSSNYAIIIQENKIVIDLFPMDIDSTEYSKLINEIYSKLFINILDILNIKFTKRIGFRYIFENKIQFTDDNYDVFNKNLNDLMSTTKNSYLNNIINNSNNTILKITNQYDKENNRSYNLILATPQHKMNFQGIDINIASYNIDLDFFQIGNIKIHDTIKPLINEFTTKAFKEYNNLKNIWE